jgi:hypothetical protein
MRKALFPLFLLLFAGMAFAASTPYQKFDVNVISPTTGAVFYPNLYESHKCVDINFQVFDDNAGSSIHYVNVYYDLNINGTDGNVFMATDLNLSPANCSFHGGTSVNFATGADCHFKYCFSSNQQRNGTFALDVNAANKTNGVRDLNAQQVLSFTIDNRYISSSTEAIVNVVPIVLVAAILIACALGLTGVISTGIIMVLVPVLIGVLVMLMIFQPVLLAMLGRTV